MKDRSKNWFYYLMRYGAGLLLFTGGAFLCNAGAGVVSMILFFVLAVLEALLVWHETKNITDFRLLLSVSWFFGLGLSTLKLTEWGTPYTIDSWLSFALFYFLFIGAFDVLQFLFSKRKAKDTAVKKQEDPKRVLIAIIVITGLSLAGLLLEAVKYSFQFPLFVRDTPHAYTEFHITGVHYFVVSSVLVSGMSMYYFLTYHPDRKQKILLIVLNALSFLVPVLLISKMHLVWFFAFPLVVFLLLQKKWQMKKILPIVAGAAVLIGIAFVVMIQARDYPEGYLEEIFRFRDQTVPVGLQYPYIYVTNNFENFNYMTQVIGSDYTLGQRQIYWAVCLTGLKFVPKLYEYYHYMVYMQIEELNTMTILYDAYGDFGLVGTALFGLIWGSVGSWLTYRARKKPSFTSVVLYMQFAVYFALSFFTTWMSHPTTWFWFAILLVISLFVNRRVKENGT